MKNAERGFTLIELLVAMAILGVIVVICGRIFEQAVSSWNTGTRKAEMHIVGRGVAGFLANDLSRCVNHPNYPAPKLSGTSPSFMIIDESSVLKGDKALQRVTYSLADPPLRSVDGGAAEKLAPKGVVSKIEIAENASAGYVDITVTVQDEVTAETKKFKARAWLPNQDRYNYED